MLFGCLCSFIAAFKSYEFDEYDRTDEKIGFALFYALTNITVVSKCPLHNRKDNNKAMHFVSLIWWIYHSVTLVVLIIIYSLDKSLLPIDIASTRLSDAKFLYPVAAAVLLIGPISIFSLRWLRYTVKQLEGAEEIKKYWDGWNPRWWDWTGNPICRMRSSLMNC